MDAVRVPVRLIVVVPVSVEETVGAAVGDTVDVTGSVGFELTLIVVEGVCMDV